MPSDNPRLSCAASNHGLERYPDPVLTATQGDAGRGTAFGRRNVSHRVDHGQIAGEIISLEARYIASTIAFSQLVEVVDLPRQQDAAEGRISNKTE